MFKFSFLLVLTLFSFAARAQDLAFPAPHELIDGEQQEPHDDRLQDLNMSPRQRDVLSDSKTRRLSNGRKSRQLSRDDDDDDDRRYSRYYRYYGYSGRDDDDDDDIFTASGKKRV